MKNEAEHISFVDGEIDPRAAGAFEIDPTHDLHALLVPGLSYRANSAARLAREGKHSVKSSAFT